MLSSGGYFCNGASGCLDVDCSDKILEFHLESEGWTEIGEMKERRCYHGASTVLYEDYEMWSDIAKWCIQN